MPLNRIRVAVVGAGYVANHHLAALGSVDFVELVGICDTNLEAARSMAVRHSIPLVVADLAELLEQSRPDAVHVLTPPASHAAIALAAMQPGCHFMVEKPMADSAADCEAMVATARGKHVRQGVTPPDRFNPKYPK